MAVATMANETGTGANLWAEVFEEMRALIADGTEIREAVISCLPRLREDAALVESLLIDGAAQRFRTCNAAERNRLAVPSTGQRKSDQALWAKKTIYDALYSVRGRWVCLGDMTAADCEALADDHGQLKEANAKMETALRHIAQRVQSQRKGKQIVRQCWQVAELEALLK